MYKLDILHVIITNKYYGSLYIILLQTLKASFTFLFYGHEVHNVTVATGGRWYMSFSDNIQILN